MSTLLLKGSITSINMAGKDNRRARSNQISNHHSVNRLFHIVESPLREWYATEIVQRHLTVLTIRMFGHARLR